MIQGITWKHCLEMIHFGESLISVTQKNVVGIHFATNSGWSVVHPRGMYYNVACRSGCGDGGVSRAYGSWWDSALRLHRMWLRWGACEGRIHRGTRRGTERERESHRGTYTQMLCTLATYSHKSFTSSQGFPEGGVRRRSINADLMCHKLWALSSQTFPQKTLERPKMKPDAFFAPKSRWCTLLLHKGKRVFKYTLHYAKLR